MDLYLSSCHVDLYLSSCHVDLYISSCHVDLNISSCHVDLYLSSCQVDLYITGAATWIVYQLLQRGPSSQQLPSGPLYLSSCQVDLYISAAATWTYISAAACQHTVVLTGSHHRGNCIVMFSATLSDSPHAVHASDDSNFLIVRPIAQSSVISCVRMYCILYVYSLV